MTSSISVRALPKDASDKDIEATNYVMNDAYKNSVFSNYLVGGHASLLPSLNRAMIKATLIGGKIYVAEAESGDIVGVSGWFGPGEGFPGPEGQAEAGFDKFMEELRSKDPDMPTWWTEYYLPTIESFLSDKLGGPEYILNGWYLHLICVLSSYQRRGIATALVKFVEAEAAKNPDTESKHLSVGAESGGGLEFYRSVGFVDKGETTFKSEKKLGGTMSIWCLAKELA